MSITASFSYEGKNYVFEHTDPHDHIFGYLRTGRFYECKLLEEVKRRAKKGIYIDAGANIGNHSVFFVDRCPCDTLIAIEPNPEAYSLLEINLNKNLDEDKFKKCLLHKWALFNKETRGRMFPPFENNLGAVRFVEDPTGPIFAKKLDDLLGDITGVAVLKVDVEYIELKVLEGAEKVIALNKPTIICEAHDNDLRALEAYMARINYIRSSEKYDEVCAPTYFFDPKPV